MNTPLSPKVAAGGITSAAALLIVYVAGLFGLDVPAEVAIAAVGVAIYVAGYFTRDPLRQDAGEVNIDPETFDENAPASDLATGGIVGSPTMGVVGDAGPEEIRPLRDL